MRVALGADHHGVAIKASVRRALDEAARGGSSAPAHTYVDFGAHSEEAVDYPDFAQPVAEGVASGAFDRGVLICGSGVGMSIAANKVPGVRAALVHDPDGARLCREHNDANVVTLAGRTLAPDAAAAIVETFLATPAAGGRHERRRARIAELERRREGAPGERARPGAEPAGDAGTGQGPGAELPRRRDPGAEPAGSAGTERRLEGTP